MSEHVYLVVKTPRSGLRGLRKALHGLVLLTPEGGGGVRLVDIPLTVHDPMTYAVVERWFDSTVTRQRAEREGRPVPRGGDVDEVEALNGGYLECAGMDCRHRLKFGPREPRPGKEQDLRHHATAQGWVVAWRVPSNPGDREWRNHVLCPDCWSLVLADRARTAPLVLPGGGLVRGGVAVPGHQDPVAGPQQSGPEPQ